MSPAIRELVHEPIPATTSGHTIKKGKGNLDPDDPIQPHLNALSQAYADLQEQNLMLRSKNTTLQAHCAIAGTEIQELRRCLNSKENKSSKRRKFNIEARWLNSDEGLRLAEEQEAARVAEEQKKCEAQELRALKEAERKEQRRLRDPNVPFTGLLSSKSKADLQDIVHALGISMDGQKKDLLGRINTHFDANTALRNHPRYEGLFNRSRRRPAAPQAEGGNMDAATPMSSNIVNHVHTSFISPYGPGPYPPIDPSLYFIHN
jgi:hypothetical protein